MAAYKNNQRGNSTLECVLTMALIAVTALMAVSNTGGSTSKIFTTAGSSMAPQNNTFHGGSGNGAGGGQNPI